MTIGRTYIHRLVVLIYIIIMYIVPCLAQQTKSAVNKVECWKILKLRQSTWSQDKAYQVEGMIYLCDKYIEVDCYELRLYLQVVKMNKYSDNYYSIDVIDYDEFYNHVEVRQAFGSMNKKDLYVIIGRQDEDGNMQSSVIITCRNMTSTPNVKRQNQKSSR